MELFARFNEDEDFLPEIEALVWLNVLGALSFCGGKALEL